MADETDTHGDSPAAPTPPRRRAPRTSSRKADAGKAETAKKEPTKRAPARKPAAQAEEAKPAAKATAAKRAPAKPRAAKRQTPAPKSRKAQASAAVEKATDKVGGKWNAAAIAGGVAAVGAAAAALFTLRGSSRKPVEPGSTGKTKPVAVGGVQPAHAHQPDGTDSSKSFEAGIADENTIPEA